MEHEQIGLQVLLEISLQQSCEDISDSTIQKLLQLYLRKLNCFLAGITLAKINPIAIPTAIQQDQYWTDIQDLVSKKVEQTNESIIEISINNDIIYAYKMSYFGWLILGRKYPLNNQIKFELVSLINQLGRNCCQISEENRLKLLQNLLDNSSDGIQVANEDGSLYYVNGVAANELNINPNNSLNYNVKELYNNFKDESKWIAHLDELKEVEYLTIEGKNLNRTTGEYFNVEVTAKLIEIDKKSFVLANSRNITVRKKAEKEFIDVKTRLESILNEMNDVVWSAQLPDFKLILVTPSIKKLYGDISIEQWVENKEWWKTAIYPDDEYILKEIFDEAKKYGHYSKEYRIVDTNGTIKWIKNKGKIIFDANNVPIRVDGILIDCTVQNLAEENLRKELLLQNILINISSTYINLDLDKVDENILNSLEELGRFVEADRAYVFEYNFDNNTASITHEWCNKMLSPIKKELVDVSLEPYKYWIEKHKQNQINYIPLVSQIDPKTPKILVEKLKRDKVQTLITFPMHFNNELIGFVGFDSIFKPHQYTEKEQKLLSIFAQMLINIRERRKWIYKISLQEEKYRNIIANMNLGLIEVDKNNIVLSANNTFCDMSGYSVEELMGNNILKLVVKSDNYYKIKDKINIREKGISDSYEIKIINKNKEEKWWFISGAPNYNDKGELIGSIGIHLDITEHKKLEEELAHSKNIAELAAKSKEIFLTNMSHEIRTPLNVIIGLIRLLLKENLSKEQMSYVKHSGVAAKHLLTIINNILDMSKIESGELELENKDISINALAYNAYSILYSKTKEKGIDYNIYVSPELFTAHIGDELRIRQVLINLIGNAIKFTETGSVSLRIDVLETTPTHQTIYIEIEDTGIGMSDEFVARIFDKFSQEQDANNRKFEGTGLGMAISRDLILLMNSDLTVESKKGFGTKFSFKLSLPKGDKDNLVQIKKEVLQNALEGNHILIVEDNPMNRFIASRSLLYLGCTYEEAENGLIALEKVKNNNFDLILMDIQMPEMDGLEATKIIRNQLKLNIPIVALTANAFKHDIDIYLSSGFNDYITKPYDEIEFFRKMDFFLRKESLNHQLKELTINQTLINLNNNNLYNLSELHQISNGSTEFLQTMLQLFLDLLKENLELYQKAQIEKNAEAIAKISHKIKPSLAQMGITSLKEDILILEKTNPENFEQNSTLLTKVCKTLHEIYNEIVEKEINK